MVKLLGRGSLYADTPSHLCHRKIQGTLPIYYQGRCSRWAIAQANRRLASLRNSPTQFGSLCNNKMNRNRKMKKVEEGIILVYEEL